MKIPHGLLLKGPVSLGMNEGCPFLSVWSVFVSFYLCCSNIIKL